LTGKNNKRIYGDINDNCLDNLFNAFYAVGDHGKNLDVNPALPIIYYGGNKPEAFDFLKKYKVKEDVMYNIPSQMKMSGNKSEFYKMFDGSWWLPKSVYSVKDAEKLNFPVIGKPDGEHSGIGIEIFDKYEDIVKSELEFDNFSEAKDLVQEFRVLMMNDKICLVNERISKSDNEMRDKETDEQTEFVYVDQDLDKLDFLDDVLKISEEIRKEIKLGLWSIDIMIDTDGKLWVAEINSSSGLGPAKMAMVYITVYEDFYKTELPLEFKEYITVEYINAEHKINMKHNAESIRKSEHRIKELK
jgi:glutathione synthase/RimK-type ligase-like ATP-grasp enzyme